MGGGYTYTPWESVAAYLENQRLVFLCFELTIPSPSHRLAIVCFVHSWSPTASHTAETLWKLQKEVSSINYKVNIRPRMQSYLL
jgi:hypothetical protein